MFFLATRTRPFSVRQRESFVDVVAHMAGLGGRIPAVDLNDLSSIPSCLVFDLPHQFVEAHVRYRLRQPPVRHHPLDVQVFQHDHLVLVHDAAADPMEMVAPDVGNLLVALRHQLLRPDVVVRPLDLPADRLL